MSALDAAATPGVAGSVTQVNSVLVIGDAQVGKKFIVQRLMQSRTQTHTAASASSSDTVATPVVLPASGIEAYELRVDTKYYSAPLTFHVLPASKHAQFSGDDSAAAVASCAAATAASLSVPAAAAPLSADARAEFSALDVQAAVLVFDLNSSASFHALAARWLPFMQERSPSVMLCVGNQRTNAAVTPSQRVEMEELELLARDWSLDNGFEYVSMPHNDALTSARTALGKPSAAAGAELDELDPAAEPVGVSRILEALECNIWNFSQMKDRKTLQYMRGAEARGLPKEDADDIELAAAEEEAQERAFASMQEEKQKSSEDDFSASYSKSNESEEKFEEFVSAFPFVTQSAGVTNSVSLSETAPAQQVAHTPANTSIPLTATAPVSASAPKSANATSSQASRSASASAFASAFARAIRTDDVPALKSQSKVPTAAAASASASKSDASASVASAAVSTTSTTRDRIDQPLSTAEIDALAAQLQQHAGSDVDGVPEEGDEHKMESNMVAFDAMFDKLAGIKADAQRARAGGEGAITDAERRARAEETVKRLLQSMGMSDELDGDSEPEEVDGAAVSSS